MIDVVVEDEGWTELIGEEPEALALRVAGAFAPDLDAPHAVLLFADDAALQALNRDFRDQDKPTNVLAFPAAGGEGGDVALARETLAREAAEQGKAPRDHAAHLIAHGLLHLMGYDHMTDSEAAEMEALERAILARLGIADPYEQEP